MITITNTLETNFDGKAKYIIKINDEKITTFWHNPSHGLSICLMQAANAIIQKNQKDMIRGMAMIVGD